MEIPNPMTSQPQSDIHNSPKPDILDGVVKRRLTPDSSNTDGFAIAFHMMQKLEQSFQAMERQYRETVNSIKDIIYRVDQHGNLVFLNPSWEEVTGFRVVESVTFPFTEFLLPEDRESATEHFNAFIEGKTDQYQRELRYQCKDGGFRWVEMSARRIYDEDGNVSGMAGILKDITGIKKTTEKLHLQIQRLSALRTINLSIASSFDLRITLSVLLEYITSLLNVDAATVLLYNKNLGELEFAAQRGFHSTSINRIKLKLGENFAGLAALEQHSIHVPDLRSRIHELGKRETISSEGFVSYFAIPLISKGSVKGVLEVFQRSFLSWDEDWLEFLEALANQTAIAIDNAELFRELQRTNADLRHAYDTTIEGWSKALDLRDKETEGHTQRVTEMTVALALEIGVSEHEIINLRRGSLLHDIGKLGVPDYILLKQDSLNEEERLLMMKHPQYAFDMLSPIVYLRDALDIPYFHHEKWDGTGYPHGLKGETIPLAARIFAVVDVWDALTTDRPYRHAWSRQEAMDHILSLAGSHFDPAIVEAFQKFVASQSD